MNSPTVSVGAVKITQNDNANLYNVEHELGQKPPKETDETPTVNKAEWKIVSIKRKPRVTGQKSDQMGLL